MTSNLKFVCFGICFLASIFGAFSAAIEDVAADAGESAEDIAKTILDVAFIPVVDEVAFNPVMDVKEEVEVVEEVVVEAEVAEDEDEEEAEDEEEEAEDEDDEDEDEEDEDEEEEAEDEEAEAAEDVVEETEVADDEDDTSEEDSPAIIVMEDEEDDEDEDEEDDEEDEDAGLDWHPLAGQTNKYSFVNWAKEFKDAAQECQDEGGYLVEINTEEENNAIKDMLSFYKQDMDVWLGCSDKQGEAEGTYVYERSGEPITYSDWAAIEEERTSAWRAEHDCVVMTMKQEAEDYWMTHSCSAGEHKVPGFVCEKDD